MNRRPTNQAAPSRTAIDRRALIAVAVQFFVNGAMTASFAARLPEIRDQIGVTVAQLGLVLTGVGLFGLLGSAIAGRVLERWHTRPVLVVGAVVMVLALPLIGAAGSPLVLAVGLLAYVFVDVLVDIAMNLQGSWLSARRAVPVMNRLHGLWSLGSVIGGLAAAQAASLALSLTWHLSIVAVISAGLSFVVVRGLLRVDEDGHEDAPAGAGAADAVDAGSGEAGPALRASRSTLIALALGGAFAVVLEQTGSDWAAFRLADDFGAAAGLASLAFVAFTVGMTIGRFGGDWVQARLGRDRLHLVAVGLATGGLAVASLVPNEWIVLGAYVIAGLGVATFLPKLYDDAARTPGRRGAGLGVMTAGTRLGGLLAPAIVGLLAGTSLSVGSAIAIVTMPCAVGFFVVTAAVGRRTSRMGGQNA